MTANDLRQKYLDFFISKGHKQIPPAPLVPVNDPTTLFTSSGMQPLVPYLLGQVHPLGKRLTDSQPSFRAEDIEEIGDNRHTTFFEMLGNWSLGDYFKAEQLPWFFEFLTKIVGLDQKRLYVSVFEGNKSVPKDTESIQIWQKLFNTKALAQAGEKGFDEKIKIYTYPAEKNWWSRSGVPEKMPKDEIGGPDSEVFFDFDPENKLKIHQQSEFKDKPCHINCDCGRFLEIGNSVFMQYQKKADGSLAPLPNKNVDFGGGLERILAAKLDTPDIFKTDFFYPAIKSLEGLKSNQTYKQNPKPYRIILDHIRAAIFMIADGVEASNKKQGYVLRRLIRRSMIYARRLDITGDEWLSHALPNLIKPYIKAYPTIDQKVPEISEKITQEVDKFRKTIDKGLKEFQKCDPQKVDAKLAFDLFQTYGFPFEITQELLAQKGCQIDQNKFKKEFERHQEKSRTASRGMFKGGLADHSETITKLHTATHLLHASLRKILGEHVKQVGSNITSERLRFDFTHPQAVSEKELQQIEDLVNEQIQKNLKITCQTMSLEKAQNLGALAFFGQKYPDQVKVYKVGNFSLEVCGGPHIDFTGKLGRFKIKKEESCGAGKRRIYALLV